MTRSTTRPTTVRRFHLKPLSFALAVSSLSAPVLADIFKGIESTQGVTVNQTGSVATVNQSAQVGVIKTQGFGIGAEQALKAIQPNSNASLWIDVTGAARSDILGALTANGRVLISNPYGIYFGAGSQINVGSLVATTLGINGDDLLKGRIRLKDNGQSAGSVVNAGSINATGTVVLAGPTVVNEGSINAARAGMAATSDVLVDVEGDGLIFFQMNGAKAGQRLSQIGQITADGGTVDLRADARGAMADTVLNMEGLVRARSIGSRNGQVFIDGGEQGRTLVTGQIDVSGQGAGERGGQATVLGQKVELGGGANIDARGAAGGGTILVGGNYQGSGTERHATTSVVHAGATLDASAIQAGNGGQVVVWSDDLTLFSGNILVRGGAEGGNGGNAEVSGKLRLGYDGWVDARAPKGLVGNLLLDPRDITINNSLGNGLELAGADAVTDVTISAAAINNANANVTLSASRDIIVNNAISISDNGVGLTLQAARNIELNANISTNNGAITLAGAILVGSNGFNFSTRSLSGSLVSLNGTVATNGPSTRNLDITAGTSINLSQSINLGSGSITFDGNVILGGSVGVPNTISITAGDIDFKKGFSADSTNATQRRNLTLVASGNVALLSGNSDNIGAGGRLIGDLSISAATFSLGVGSIASLPDAFVKFESLNTESGPTKVIDLVATGGGTDALRLTANTLTKLSSFSEVRLGSGNGSDQVLVSDSSVTAPTSLVFLDATSLANNTEITGAGHNIRFNKTVIGGAHSLEIAGASSVTFNGAVSGITSLTTSTSATTNINANVTTTGTQVYGNQVVLGGTSPLTLKGTGITFANLDAANLSLVLQTNAINITGAITNPGATLGISTEAGTGSIGLAGASGTHNLALDATTLGKLDEFTALLIGGGNVNISASALNLGANTTLQGTTITLAAVNGNAHSLTLTSSSTKALNGDITGVTNLLANGGGTTSIGANVTTTGSQVYDDALNLGTGTGTRTLTASSIDINNGLAAGTQNLSLRTDALSIAGTVTSGTGIGVTVATNTDGLSIGVGTGAAGGPGSLQLSDTTRNALGGFKSVTIGRAGSDSAIDVTDLLNLGLDLTLIANAANITLANVTGVNAGIDLTLNSSTGVTLGGAITGLGSLSSIGTGGVAVNANVTTTGLQSYTGDVTLGGTDTRSFSGSALSFAGINANNRSLTLNTLSLNISGAVSNAGGQATLTTLNGTGSIGLAGAVGDLALNGLTLGKFNGFAILLIGGGNVNIAADELTLGTNTTLSSGSGTITLAAVTGSTKGLTLTGSGLTKVGGAINGVSDLLINGGGNTELNADVTTSTSIVINDAITSLGTGGTRSLRSDSINLQGNITAGSQSLNLRADTLTVAGTSTANSGTGVTLSTNTDGRSIGLAGAAGDTSISQATLNALSGFKALTIGRTDSNSAITASTVNYTGGDLTFRSGTATISLTGTGVTTTNGAQTYDGAVNLSAAGTGNHTFSATALTFQKGVQANSHNVTLKADALNFGTGAGIFGNDVANQTITIAAKTASTNIGLGFSGGAGSLSVPLNAITDFKALVLGDSAGTGKITLGTLGGGSAVPSDFASLSITTGSGDIDVNAGLGNSGLALSSLSVASTSGTVRLNGVEVHASQATFTGKTELSNASGSNNVFHGSDLAFNGTVDSAPASSAVLDASDVTTTRFTGVVGGTRALGSVSTRDVQISGDITASTLVSLAGSVSLFAGSSITAPSITLGGTGAALTANGGGTNRSLTLVSDNLPTFQFSSVSVGANLTLAPLTDTRDIKIGDVSVANTLMISASTLQAFSTFNQITVGSSTGSGTITVGDAGGSLSLSTALTINGTARIAASNISTTGAQTYERAVTLDTSSTLTASSLRIKGAIEGQSAGGQSLSTNTSGNTRLDAAMGATTPLATVAITAGSLSLNGGSVTTTGAQTYTAPITLGSDTTLTSTGGKVTLAGTVQGTASGAQALSVSGTQVEFQQNLGSNGNRLKSVTVTGPLTLAGADVFTTGVQQYLGNVTLKANTTLTANDNVIFSGLVDGDASSFDALTVNSSGITRFSAAVGSLQALDALTTNAGGSTELGGNVTTSGAQNYNEAVTLIGATGTRAFSASELKFAANLSVGARSLRLSTNDFNLGGSLTVSAGQTASISTLTEGVSIGLADGAGSLNLSQIELNQFTGFDSLTVGRSTSSSVITASALTLPTDLILVNSTGNITLSSVAGAGHNLAVQSAGATAWNGNVSAVLNLSTDAGGSNTVAANVSTTGTQTWGDAVNLIGTNTRNFEGPTLDFQGALSAGNTSNVRFSTNSLSLIGNIGVSGSGQTAQVDTFTPGTSVGLAGAPGTLALSQAALDQFASFSKLTIGGNAGTITALALRLPTHTVLSASGDVILSTVNGAGFDLSIDSANTTLSGAISAVRDLLIDASVNTQINADISTTGTQTYVEAVILGGIGTRTFTGTGITLSKTLDVAQHDLALNTNALALNGAISGASGKQVSVSTFTGGGAIELVPSSPGGTLNLSQATLNRLAPFAQLTIGSGNNAITATTALTLSTNTTLNAGLAVVNLGVVNGAGFDLSINSGGSTTLGGAITEVRQLSTDTSGSTTVNANISTTGSQTFRDALSLGADVTFKAPELIISGPTLSVGTHGLSLIIDTLTLSAAVSASGNKAASIVTFNDGRNIVMGTSAGSGSDLVLSNITLSQFGGFGTLSIGSDNSAISATGLILPTNTTLTAGSSNIVINGLSGNSKSLTINSSALTQVLGGASGLISLNTDAAGTTQLSGSIITSGAQTYGDAVTVSGATALSSTGNADITFADTLNSANGTSGALSITTGGVTTLQGNVGSTRALASLSTDAAGSTVLPSAITATGAVSLLDQVQLTSDLTITHGGLTVGKALDSDLGQTRSLSLISAATSTFNGPLGSSRALSSITATGLGAVVLNGSASSITTTGAQSYSGDLQLTGGSNLIQGTALSVGKQLTAANGLSLITNELSIGSALSGSLANILTGTGALLIRPLSTGTSIGIGSGASGTLQITQAMLTSASGFSALTLGHVEGSGAINMGTVDLGTHTTVQSRTGEIHLTGNVNSASEAQAFDLLLNTGGKTLVAGSVGLTHAVRNFITDDNAGASNHPGGDERTAFEGQAVTIKATQSIVFNDPVTSIVKTDWRAGEQFTALASGNDLTGVVNIESANIQLTNANRLSLGDVRLTGSGESSIFTDGGLDLNGKLVLERGSLHLQSNIAPTTRSNYSNPLYRNADGTDKILTVGLSTFLGEANAGITQSGGSIATAAGSHLSVRTPQGASIVLSQAGNDLQGSISAVAGRIGEDPNSLRTSTPVSGGKTQASVLRIQSKQLYVAGRASGDGDQNLRKAGLEADVIELTLDGLNTSQNNGLIRARLPYDNNQGSTTAMPALTINISQIGLNTFRAFGGVDAPSRVMVKVGNSVGGFITVQPKNGASLGPGFISLGGEDDTAKPFYDGSGKFTEVPVFFNGDVPQTPQSVGALSAVTAVIEEARRARFEEAVRTENVSARLRSGVIAEVGSGRPATEGSSTLKLPETCTPAANSLGC